MVKNGESLKKIKIVCVCLILIKNEQWLLNPSWLMIGLSVQLSN